MKYARATAVFVLTALLFLAGASPALASEKEAGASASSFGHLLAFEPDTRASRLKKFLASYNSPLAAHSETFVAQADKHNLDWRLVAAIAGTESTFGQHVPAGSYNAWGWGIPTGAQSGIGFQNWDHGIETVSRGLRTNYVDRGALTIEAIGRIYAASPRWAGNVRFFIDKIDAFEPSTPQALALTI